MAYFDQICRTFCVTFLVVLLDEVFKQDLEPGPVALFIALCEGLHCLLVVLDFFQHLHEVFLALRHPGKYVHNFLVV